jgi:hypothetical protein
MSPSKKGTPRSSNRSPADASIWGAENADSHADLQADEVLTNSDRCATRVLKTGNSEATTPVVRQAN